MTPDLAAKIAELEAGCEGVTPGPWHVKDYGPKRMLEIYSSDMDAGNDGRPVDRGERICDMADTENESDIAAHIARCDPQTILALIAAWRAEKVRADEAETEFIVAHKMIAAGDDRIAALEVENEHLRGSFKWQDGPPV